MRQRRPGQLIFCLTALILSLLLPAFLSGCAENAEKEIVFTSSFGADEVFRIETKKCSLAEMEIYMKASGDQYQEIFGSEIWTRNLNGMTLGQELKSVTLARLSQIKAMNLLAEDRGISLDEEEEEKVSSAAARFFDGMKNGNSQISANEALITNMYREYALADKTYRQITQDVDPEISDDEARSITVRQILIRTSTVNEYGERIPYGPEMKAEARKKAENILEELRNGGDFDTLAEIWNEDSEVQYTFGRGTMPEAFEETAFNMETGQISDIVETEYGYHILLCVSTFDQEETDANKERIVRERKKAAFDEVYDSFAETLHSTLNDELWYTISYDPESEPLGADFFRVYEEVFG